LNSCQYHNLTTARKHTFPVNLQVLLFFVGSLIGLSGAVSTIVSAQQTKKSFTVADDIGVALCCDVGGNVRFSPDGNYFAVYTERGRLDRNCVEDSLRYYRSQDVKSFLERSADSRPPSPMWIVNRSGKEGPVISKWRWLPDSTGVAFLEQPAYGNKHLVLADLRTKRIELLSTTTERVEDFDIRNRQNYVFSVHDSAEVKRWHAELQRPDVVGTGRTLLELLFPDDPLVSSVVSSASYKNLNLWAVVRGKSFEVRKDGAALVLFGGDLALSPDGGSLVTTLPVPEVPPSWESLFRSGYPLNSSEHSAFPLQGGKSVRWYVRVDLMTSSVQALTDAPIASDAGWWAYGSPSWSNDGQEILLPGTFFRSKDLAPSRPCVAVLDLPSNTHSCVEMLKGHTETGVEEGYHRVDGAQFVAGDKHRIKVSFHTREWSPGATEYRRTADGSWQIATQSTDGAQIYGDLELTVKQGLNDPPVLVAGNKQISRVIWDLNPQLKNVELGEASVYKWKDNEQRERTAGLYKPINYKQGERYPLVIQTHGFVESQFVPAGLFPTADAARALAAAGIMVLQVGDVGDCGLGSANEGSCNATGYEVVIKQLVFDGLVDPDRIGIIGFSRTCFYVMEALTASSLQLRAASVNDGFMVTYFQYMMWPEHFPSSNSIVGASPFGQGLQQWLKRSPGFNLDKIRAPLLIVSGEGPAGLLMMWEPYAGLHYLKRPVDLIMLNTNEHVLTNPAVRMASQGGSVDWFRFWLQDYEDPDPVKVEQYARWRELRKLQKANEGNVTPKSPSN
jgi:dipeptidyl aminopeptidase/acylaminoacyl peptidase